MDKVFGIRNEVMMRLAFMLLLALVTFGLVSCNQASEDAQADTTATKSTDTASSTDQSAASSLPYTFTDDLGNEVAVESTDKVVACMGSFARTWELAGGSLVGVSDDAIKDYGVASEGVATIGDFSNPNLEEIIGLSPDFVIMTGASTGRNGAANQTDLKESLEASGITVAYFDVTTFEDYLRMLRTFCDINGRDDLYEENGEAVAQRIADIKGKVSSSSTEDAPTVMLMTTHSGGTRVQDSSTMTGAMLAELGAKNLADENRSLLKEFSLEAIIEMNPDYILVVPMGNDDEAAMRNLKEVTEANPAWATLDAVQNDRFVTLDKGLFLYKPNNAWDKSYQTLYDLLYA